ncbi:MAG: hypothetical protein C5B49_10080 [Bdellovibrio sp.]|nr:MAG: hypothetical protein C5B49_10080 [Bdellovibrio sp.]
MVLRNQDPILAQEFAGWTTQVLTGFGETGRENCHWRELRGELLGFAILEGSRKAGAWGRPRGPIGMDARRVFRVQVA